jgi:hypothetical protein
MSEHPWQLGFYRDELQLSPPMRRALRAFVRETSSDTRISRGTATALARRDLLDHADHLTPFGRVIATGLLPLREQCEQLDLPLEERRLRWQNRPEDAAAVVLGGEHVRAFADEGRTLHALIHALVLPCLREAAAQVWADRARARSYLYSHFAGYRFLLDDCPLLPTTMLKSVDGVDAETFRAAWTRLGRWNLGMFSDHPATRLSSVEAVRLLDHVGRHVLRDALALHLSLPGAYGSGWPDLTLIGARGGADLVEVKTTDRLHFSQIVTFGALQRVPGLRIRVLRLRPLSKG